MLRESTLNLHIVFLMSGRRCYLAVLCANSPPIGCQCSVLEDEIDEFKILFRCWSHGAVVVLVSITESCGIFGWCGKEQSKGTIVER